MSAPSFPDGNGIRHAMQSDPRTIPWFSPGTKVSIMSMCMRRFAVRVDEILGNEPASCMSCLVHEARESGS